MASKKTPTKKPPKSINFKQCSFSVFVKQVRDLFQQAEIKLSEANHENGALLVPAVNELRYAGYHLIKALAAKEEGPKNAASKKPNEPWRTELRKSKDHCARALYDIDDALLIARLEEIKDFRETFYRIEIDDIVQDEAKDIGGYVDILDAAREAKTFSAKIRLEEKQYKQRQRYYQKLSSHLKKLTVISDQLRNKRALLLKRARNHDRKITATYISLGLGILAILITLLLAPDVCTTILSQILEIISPNT